MENNNINPFRVLLIEDNPGDIRLIQEGFKENKFLIELNVISDGEEASEFLKSEEGNITQRPDLILLDLNLPKKDGRELLTEIKNDDKLKTIPVVILTSSSEERDVLKSYQNYANCFIPKPLELDSFINVVKSIESFWFTIVKLPG